MSSCLNLIVVKVTVTSYETWSHHKWKFLQHALSRYVYNRSLFDIFTQVEMAEE